MAERPIIERLRELGASEPLADEAANVIGDLLDASDVAEEWLRQEARFREPLRRVRAAIAKARGGA